jgi:hypothetical protein
VNRPEISSITQYYLPRELELSILDVKHEVAVLHGSEADVRRFIKIIEAELRCLVELIRHLSDVVRGPEFRTCEYRYGNTIMKIIQTYPVLLAYLRGTAERAW